MVTSSVFRDKGPVGTAEPSADYPTPDHGLADNVAITSVKFAV